MNDITRLPHREHHLRNEDFRTNYFGYDATGNLLIGHRHEPLPLVELDALNGKTGTYDQAQPDASAATGMLPYYNPISSPTRTSADINT